MPINPWFNRYLMMSKLGSIRIVTIHFEDSETIRVIFVGGYVVPVDVFYAIVVIHFDDGFIHGSNFTFLESQTNKLKRRIASEPCDDSTENKTTCCYQMINDIVRNMMSSGDKKQELKMFIEQLDAAEAEQEHIWLCSH